MSANNPTIYPPSPSTYTYPGSKWWKMDFHTHSPHSTDYPKDATPEDLDSLKNLAPKDWLLEHMRVGLDALVLTDHNGGGFIDQVKSAYLSIQQNPPPDFREIVIFPGVEVTTGDGFHLLAIVDPSCGTDAISTLLGSMGYPADAIKGDANGMAEKNLHQCIEVIHRANGLAVPGHADKAKGFLHNEKGITREIENILKFGPDAIEVLDWASIPVTLRNHPRLARLARVNGSDSHHPKQIGRYGFSMVHMTKPNLEGLRMAFADGSALQSSGGTSSDASWSVRPIAREDTTDWNVWPDHAVEKLSISHIKTAGRVQPLEFPLHPRFNVLVGGRGSGKSTFVHALRLATHRGRELPRYEGDVPVSESPAGDFWRWAHRQDGRNQESGIILSNSDVKVLYRSPAQIAELDWQASFLGQGATSSPPTVRIGPTGSPPSEDGGAYATSRFPMSIYSQKQVLEMSRGSAGLLEIIDREQNVAVLEEQLKLAIATYSSTQAKIRELTTTLANEAQDSASLKDIVSELQKIQSDAVKEYQRRQSQARALLPNLKPDSPQILLAQELIEQADRLGLPDVSATLLPADDAEVLAAHEIYQSAQTELDAIASQIRAQSTAIQTVLTKLDQDLRSSTWFDACMASKTAYDTLLGAQTAAFDPARLTKLNQDRAQLETRLARHQGTRNEITKLQNTAVEQLKTVYAARKAISTARNEFIAAHNAKDTLLKLTLLPMGAPLEEVERSLREALGIDSEKFIAAISDAEGSRPNSLMNIFKAEVQNDTAEKATNALRQRVFGLIDSTENEQGFADFQNNLRKQIQSNPSRKEIIETWFPKDYLKLEYRTSESTAWKSISQGSIGQQTAAVLSFLLSFGNEPLVLDQPEDDLDNRMIMSLIVEQVRTMKTHRQIIIVTHNPNIVVHGDADLVHAMEDVNGQVSRNQNASGGLQEKATREFICDVMEGGVVAFRKRFDRMGRQEI